MVENCTDVNNATCDLRIIGDLNMTEHLNQTIEPLYGWTRQEKVRNTISVSEKQFTEKKEELLKKMKLAQNKKIMMKEGKRDSEEKITGKKKKLLIPSAIITGRNVLHCGCMGKSTVYWL